MAQMKDYKYGSNAAVLKDRVNGGDASQNGVEPPAQNNRGVITAQMKDYKYGSNAAVLKDRANSGKQVQKNSGVITATMKDVSAKPPLVLNKNDPYTHPFSDPFGGSKPSVPKNTKGTLGGKYDETKWRDRPTPTTFKGVPDAPGVSAPKRPQTNPADLSGAEDRIAAGRTLGSGITLSQTATGEVAAFGPDGKKVDLKDPETRAKFGLPTGGSGQPGVVQPGGSSDFTGQFDQGAAVFAAQMAALNRGEKLPPQPGTQQGFGMQQQPSSLDPLQAQRNSLQSRLDAYGTPTGTSVNSILKHQMKTRGVRSELERVDQQILGRDGLSAKIQEALIGANSALAAQQLKGSNDLATQELQNSGALMKQLFENQGTMDVRKMMEGNENLRADKALASSLLGSTLGQKGSQKDHVAEFKKSGLLEAVKSIVTNNPDLANNPEAFSKILDSMAKGTFGGNEKVKGAADDLLKD